MKVNVYAVISVLKFVQLKYLKGMNNISRIKEAVTTPCFEVFINKKDLIEKVIIKKGVNNYVWNCWIYRK